MRRQPMPTRISDHELSADLQAVADDLGEVPTVRQYREHGEYTDSTLRTRFGSWSDALQAAGLDDTGSKRPVPTAELIDDLQALAVKLGEPPTATQMDERGPRWRSVYQDRFGSWNEALAAAGLEPNQQHRPEGACDESGQTETEGDSRAGPIETDAIIDSLQAVADDLGEPPTRTQFDERGVCSDGTVYNRFGSWDAALEAAGLDPDAPRGNAGPSEPRISDAELVADIQRLADASDEPPTLQDYRDAGEYGAQTMYDRFGSWNDALEAAGFGTREPDSEVSETELLAELSRLADDGTPPTVAEMRRDGAYWVSTYQNHFGSWSAALQEAGLDGASQSSESSADDDVT